MPGASVVTILSTFPFYLRQMSNGNLSGSGDESCGTGMLGVEGVMAIVNRWIRVKFYYMRMVLGKLCLSGYDGRWEKFAGSGSLYLIIY